ncbi:MAG: thiol-disulfide oxidoreductase DCC family protein, partial [Nevskiales bacterium]
MAAGSVSSPDGKVIVFDGVCLLCNRSIAFVLKHDRQKQFRFATMQSAAGSTLLRAQGLNPEDPLSFLLLEDGIAYTDSDAAIRVVCSFGGIWRLLGLLRLVPRVLRDAVYRWIARNRYRWFG